MSHPVYQVRACLIYGCIPSPDSQTLHLEDVPQPTPDSDEAQAAYDLVQTGKNVGKVVLTVS